LIEEGDRVLLLGKRRLTVTVENGMSKIGHGTADLSKLIGMEYGESVKLWGQEFRIYPASLRDIMEDFERGPQVILPKDSAFIVQMCEAGEGKHILEAGVGSGWLTAQLAYSVAPGGKVISYDISERSIQIAKRNMEKAGLSHISEIRHGDIRNISPEEGFDSAVLDMPDPWDALDTVYKALVPGGHLCIYVPTFNQVERSVLAMEGRFFDVSARELIERETSVKEGATRPAYNGLMHTGYLIHGRRA